MNISMGIYTVLCTYFLATQVNGMDKIIHNDKFISLESDSSSDDENNIHNPVNQKPEVKPITNTIKSISPLVRNRCSHYCKILPLSCWIGFSVGILSGVIVSGVLTITPGYPTNGWLTVAAPILAGAGSGTVLGTILPIPITYFS